MSQNQPLYIFVLILGKAASGKTTLTEQYLRDHILMGKRQVKILDNKEMFPPGALPGGYQSEFPGIDHVDDWLADLIRPRQRPRHGLPPLTLALDDVDKYTDAFVRKGSPWRQLSAEYRHYRMSVLASSRRFQELPTIMRTNTTHYAFFRAEGYNMKEAIRKELGPEVLAKVPTVPYRYLLVDRDADTMETYSTKARATKTDADS